VGRSRQTGEFKKTTGAVKAAGMNVGRGCGEEWGARAIGGGLAHYSALEKSEEEGKAPGSAAIREQVGAGKARMSGATEQAPASLVASPL